MKKIIDARKKLLKHAAIASGITVAAFAVAMSLGQVADRYASEHAQLETTVSSKNVELSNVLNQAGNANEAKRRFAEISLDKETKDFRLNTSAMKNVLKELQQQMRLLPGLKLTIAPETVDARPEFTGLPKQVVVREDMQVSFSAMSDAHVMAFLKALQSRATGLIQITHISMQRTSDVTAAVLSQMSSGGTPSLVNATIKFRWIGLSEKPETVATP